VAEAKYIEEMSYSTLIIRVVIEHAGIQKVTKKPAYGRLLA
jgi:hypothetical protein